MLRYSRGYLALLLRVAYPERCVRQFDLGGSSVVLSPASIKEQNTVDPTTERDALAVCDEISSLAINAPPESSGVTTFVQEACEASSALAAHYKPSPYNVTSPSFDDLKEYFRRPKIISTGVLNTTNANIALALVNQSVLFTNYFPNGVQRLQNVYGVRFKMVFRLQVSTTPFNQGVVALSWQYSTLNNTQMLRASQYYACTQLPHARLDLSTSTAVELHVPWMSSAEFMAVKNLTNNLLSYGTWSITPIVAGFAAATAITPSYKLYLHLEDMELIGAIPLESQFITLQSGRVVEREFEDDTKPLSSGLYSAAKTVKWIAKGVPSLSSLAGTASWVLHTSAGVARYFGYSKPLIQDPVTRMINTDSVLEQNVDMPTAAQMCGPLAHNHLATSPTFAATDVDEMSIDYIKGIYSIIKTGNITTTDAYKTVLYATAVSPSNFWFRSTQAANPQTNITAPRVGTTTANCFYPSNVFWLASMFRYWRGGFRFRVTFGKTKFHAGRVIFSYIPNDAATGGVLPPYITGSVTNVAEAPVGTVNIDTSGYSAIWDLKDSNVFEFDVPYVCDTPYKQFVLPIGSVTMTVVDPLIAPASVASTVQYLVEVKALPDFEVAFPVGPAYPAMKTDAYSIRLQSGKMLSNYAKSPAEDCIGERITSLKQLIMIPHAQFLGTLAASTTATWAVLPWWWVNSPPTGSTVGTVFGRGCFNFGGHIAQAYVYCKGSTDVHIYSGAQGTGPVVLARLSWLPGNQYNTTNGGNNPGQPTSTSVARVCQSGPNGAVHVRMPAYQKYQRISPDFIPNSVNWVPGFTASQTTYPVWGPSDTYYDGSLIVTAVAATSSNTIVQTRCAGDDAACGHYIGPPMLALLNPVSTTTTLYDPDSSALS